MRDEALFGDMRSLTYLSVSSNGIEPEWYEELWLDTQANFPALEWFDGGGGARHGRGVPLRPARAVRQAHVVALDRAVAVACEHEATRVFE